MLRYILAAVVIATCITIGESWRVKCMVYGDPHIVLFNDRHLTCGECGWQNVLSNKYVSIQGFMNFVRPGWWPTYMTWVIIKFYNSNGGYLGMYEAKHNMGPAYRIPTKFINGATILYDSSLPAITITKITFYTVWIAYQAAGIDIFVARWRYTYMLTVRQPPSLTSTGLCWTGCEPINIKDFFKRFGQQRGKRQAEKACANVPQEYYDDCVFDYKVTGSAELAAAPGKIMSEITEMLNRKEEEVTKGPDLQYDLVYTRGTI